VASSGVIGNAAFAPVSELITKVLVLVKDTIHAAKDVIYDQESLRELSKYLENIRPILTELNNKNVRETQTIRKSLGIFGKGTQGCKECY
jgi:hypothetical protein